jgi:predicted nucleotidyltransferase
VAAPVSLSKAEILRLFDLLNAELERQGASAELYLVGGAVMCLALGARDATRDVDALFKPTALVREAAARVARKAGVSVAWLNDAVKAWLSPHGEFDPYLERSHLSVFVAQPAYLLAMKCAAMRLGEEFHDLDDVRYLLRYLNITTATDALAVVARYFDESAIPLKTKLALEELLGG